MRRPSNNTLLNAIMVFAFTGGLGVIVYDTAWIKQLELRDDVKEWFQMCRKMNGTPHLTSGFLDTNGTMQHHLECSITYRRIL